MLMCLGLGERRRAAPSPATALCKVYSITTAQSADSSTAEGIGAEVTIFAGSMFNHSSRPNVDYRVDVDRLVISFTTARDVQQGAFVLGLSLGLHSSYRWRTPMS